ncbi:MAG TPA: hypothetical protein PK156_34900, partial [Polyangium sp.]|nr:hypothetical protein [Polyangium sp.]
GTGEAIVLHAGDIAVHSVSWSLNGRDIAATFDDGTLVLWKDVEIIEDARDARLWSATRECLSSDQRRQLLGFSEAQSQSDLENCRRRVAEAGGAQH